MFKNQKGITLLEVLFSVVVISIIVVAYVGTLGTAVSTNEVVTDANAVAALAFKEIEELRGMEFGKVPFAKTSDADGLQEIPNYLYNILPDIVDASLGEEYVPVITTGDLGGYPRSAAADGLRADDTTAKWVAERNLLTDGVSEGPDASGPEGEDPGGSGGGSGGPGAGGLGFEEGYQFWMVDLGAEQKISRVLYDNRFNTFESLTPGLDSLVHRDDVWQREWRFFYRESELALGEIFDPRIEGETLVNYFGGRYGSTGINVIWDDEQNNRPLYAGVLGITEIDTYTDFNEDFHWPYVTEVEVYGYDKATNYVRSYTDSAGNITYHNIINYFPNYKNSGFDLGRRCYVPAEAVNFDPSSRIDLFRVELNFYLHDRVRNTDEWMDKTWWQADGAELSRFITSFYRNRETRRDNLPYLPDFPEHLLYYDNEDIYIEYNVPDATGLRLYFSTFDLPEAVTPAPPTDYVEFYDIEGTRYIDDLGRYQFFGRPADPNNIANGFGPWVDGNTIVIHFHSDGAGNSFSPEAYKGFKVGRVEARKPQVF